MRARNTLISDLSCSEDELRAKMTKTIKNEMYEEKEIHGHYLPISELKEYAKQNALIITTAEINNNISAVCSLRAKLYTLLRKVLRK